MNYLKENIIRLLKEQGKTQADLSQSLGITIQALQYYFKANLTLSNLQKIADSLGVDPYELIKPTNTNQPTKRGNKIQVQTICPHCEKTIKITIE